MRVWRLDDSAAPKLFLDEIPRPKPGPGEVLVRVHAAGVSPTEVLWYPTTHTKTGEARSQAILGHEFSGTVAMIGPEVSQFAIGQEIFGMNDWFADGATAEYCIARPEWLALKPRHLTHDEAAPVPIGALTAWQGLFDRAQVQPGERVLVHGGAGAVGVFAVQLARLHGAHVVTTASERNREFLFQLGVEQVIDYKAEHFEERVHGIDVVFDTVGGNTLECSWNVLGLAGRLITIAASSEGSTDERTKRAFFIVVPNQSQLIQIASLLETGEIQPVVDAVVPFARADAAYGGAVTNRLGRGKLVVAITED